MATFDNSKQNPHNPDPESAVTWGEQTWAEMMVGFFDVAVDPAIDKQRFFLRTKLSSHVRLGSEFFDLEGMAYDRAQLFK